MDTPIVYCQPVHVFLKHNAKWGLHCHLVVPWLKKEIHITENFGAQIT